MLLLLACSAPAPQRPPALPQPAVLWPTDAVELPTQAADPLPFTPDAALQSLLDPRQDEPLPSWAGADVASSIAINDNLWIWIFGDTLLGSLDGPCADDAAYCGRTITETDETKLLRNSIGVAERGWFGSMEKIQTWWRRGPAGEATAAFPSEDRNAFLWPLSGLVIDETLFIAANRHTLASGLAPVGNVLLQIENPGDSPDAWQISERAIPGFVLAESGAAAISWTSALVAVGNWVYLVGARQNDTRSETVLARLSLAELMADSAAPLEPRFLLRNRSDRKVWSPHFDAERLHVVPGLPGTSETTFEGYPGLGWVSFRIPPFSFEIRLYTADDLLGPWRDRGVVYRLPAPWSTTAATGCAPEATPEERDSDCLRAVFIAYAVKSHPELAPDKGFALSYNVNLFGGDFGLAVEAAAALPGFYVPQMLSADSLDPAALDVAPETR